MEICTKTIARKFKKENPNVSITASRWSGTGLNGNPSYWVEVKGYADRPYGSAKVFCRAVLCTSDADTEQFAKEMSL